LKLPNKPIIGWREWVSLPALGIRAVKAKIDTGARSSALHAFSVTFFRRQGREMVRFHVHPLQRDYRKSVVAEARLLERRMVRSSNGEARLRPVIVTEMVLMGKRRSIELTLIDRGTMGFRMLLGRQAIRGHFIVDPNRSFLDKDWKRRR